MWVKRRPRESLCAFHFRGDLAAITTNACWMTTFSVMQKRSGEVFWNQWNVIRVVIVKISIAIHCEDLTFLVELGLSTGVHRFTSVSIKILRNVKNQDCTMCKNQLSTTMREYCHHVTCTKTRVYTFFNKEWQVGVQKCFVSTTCNAFAIIAKLRKPSRAVIKTATFWQLIEEREGLNGNLIEGYLSVSHDTVNKSALCGGQDNNKVWY